MSDQTNIDDNINLNNELSEKGIISFFRVIVIFLLFICLAIAPFTFTDSWVINNWDAGFPFIFISSIGPYTHFLHIGVFLIDIVISLLISTIVVYVNMLPRFRKLINAVFYAFILNFVFLKIGFHTVIVNSYSQLIDKPYLLLHSRLLFCMHILLTSVIVFIFMKRDEYRLNKSGYIISMLLLCLIIVFDIMKY